MPLLIANGAWTRVKAAVREVERGQLIPLSVSRRPVPQTAGPIRVVLLDDLIDELPVDATITRLEETLHTQRLTIVGEPTGGTYRVGFRGVETVDLSPTLSAAALELALEKLSTIGKGNIRVGIGGSTGRYLLRFDAKLFNDDPLPLITITDELEGATAIAAEHTYWADTGDIVSVRNVIPVGSPTPLRAGAICLVERSGSAGLVITAAEVRQYNPYSLVSA